MRHHATTIRRPTWQLILGIVLCFVLATWPLAAGMAEEELILREIGQRMPVGPEPYFVLVDDFNGDKIPDLAVANRGELKPPADARPGNDTISVLIGKGNGTFHPVINHHVGFAPYTIENGDFDEDGLTDLAVVCFQSNDKRDVALLRGRGDGSFDKPRFLKVDSDFEYDKNRLPDGSPLFASPGLTSLDIADVNSDGHQDIVAVAWSTDIIVTFLGDGRGRFPSQRVVSGTPPGPRDVAIHDFDRDGNLDLVLTHYSSDRITLWRGDGTGNFTLKEKYHSGGQTPYHLELTDLNSDGKKDIVVGNRGVSDDVALFVAQGGIKFKHVGSYAAGQPNDPKNVDEYFRDVAVVDLDGDGSLETAAACRFADKVVIWRVIENAGVPTLKPVGEFDVPGAGPRAFGIADFDQDGAVELAVALATSRQVMILKVVKP